MKKEINPMLATVILVVFLVLLGGFFWRSQQRTLPGVSLVGADGKRHMPSAVGGGASTRTTPDSPTAN